MTLIPILLSAPASAGADALAPETSFLSQLAEASLEALLSATATIGIGLIAALIAAIAIISNRRLAKKKNSLDTILSAKGDTTLRNAISTIYSVHQNPNLEIKIFSYKENEKDEAAVDIRYALNFYEYVAVGINHGVYHEKILKESMYSTIVNIHDRCKGFIENVRTQGQKTAYCNVEKLAKKWEKKPLKK